MSEVSKIMPVVALRDITVLPHMLIHFDVSRKITIAAIEEAMKKDQNVFLVSQKDPEVNDPSKEDLHEVGSVAVVKQILKLPGNILRVMVSATDRARLLEIVKERPYLTAELELLDDIDMEDVSRTEKEGMLRCLHELIETYCMVNEKISKSVMKQLLTCKKLDELVDLSAANIPLSQKSKIEILNELDRRTRYDKLATIIMNEVNIIGIKKEFQEKVKERVDKSQKEYLLREQLKLIREELGENNAESDAAEFMEKLEELKADQSVIDRIVKEIERFKNIPGSSPESSVSRGYIETLLALPWNKESKDNDDIVHAEEILNHDHYGMEKVKERILESLAVRSLLKKGQAPILCLVGPPGVGKTSIARSVATALNKEYVRICLGGVRDEAEIRGHRRTYVGAMPGRLVEGLKAAKVKNPLMLLDEIDKVSNDYKGDTFSALLEVLDGEQNNKFYDHYVEVPVDLSEVLFIATANSLETIPRPLLDRMEVIEVTSYTENEKMHIAMEHLIRKQIQKNGLKKRQLSITETALHKIITEYTKEAGVRNLERVIGSICRKVAKQIMTGERKSVKISEKNLAVYLGKPKFTFEQKNEQDEVGIVRGLAWTSVGGDTLEIEVNVMPGKGIFELTGQLGDVMKESAKTAISYVRSVSDKYDIPKDFFEQHDIHIHIPEGAVPKDGPSAGITMATAILSAVTNKKVKADLAMTGEITLRGRALPIGGLKEKLLAAKAAMISLVLVPKKNKKDIEEIAPEILDGLTIQFVDTMDEVVSYAFA